MSHSNDVPMMGHIRRQSFTERKWIPILPVEKRLIPPAPIPGLPPCKRSREAVASASGEATSIFIFISQSMAVLKACVTSGSPRVHSMLGSYWKWETPADHSRGPML